jgi:hypothetical protein
MRGAFWSLRFVESLNQGRVLIELLARNRKELLWRRMDMRIYV